MDLVVIESPNKRASLSKYLGPNYDIFASVGHVRDLPRKSMGINVEKNFEPKYEIMTDKKKVVRELKEKAAKADHIYLATDPDREGEAIAWHIAQILKIPADEKCRISFNEISKTAVLESLKKPRIIDENLVNAQQARRILDRFVGYEISPIVCKNIKNNLSAGRVQSVALKIVVDREREIQSFKPDEFHTLTAWFKKQNSIDDTLIKAVLTTKNSKKIKPVTTEEMQSVLDDIKDQKYTVSKVKKSVRKSNPCAPFTTSTLQQDSINKLNISLKQTSMIAQQLYEGVELSGEGKVALVTYIRSDSTRVSPDAQKMAKDFILNNFGDDYYPTTPNIYKSKADAQDAHEAIRPISLIYTPERIKSDVEPKVYKLYKLIYERFLASQMSAATFNSVSLTVDCAGYGFNASGRTPLFLGYNKLYKTYSEDAEEDGMLPEVTEGENLDIDHKKAEQKFTKPPARFSEATLIKNLEEKGIGRPATYVQIISVIKDRGYTEKEGKSIKPTEIGLVVNDFLVTNFKTIINEGFTAQMEEKLDKIAENGDDWREVIGKFYKHLSELIKGLQDGGMEVSMIATDTDLVCEKCGSPMVLKQGRYGGFYACSNYPECKNTKPLFEPKVAGVCPKCGKNMLEKTSKRGTKYYACEDYKECGLMLWGLPTGEKCPECNEGYLYIAKGRKGEYIRCSNKECTFSKNIEKNNDEGDDENTDSTVNN